MSEHPPTILLPPSALDPTLVPTTLSDLAIQIDPKLLAIESLVRQCNAQIPISLDLLPEALEPEPVPIPNVSVHPSAQVQSQDEEDEHMVVDMEEEGIDPALREIVDHLAREQQEHAFPPMHLRQQALQLLPANQQDRDRDALQQSLQTTLDDLAQVSFDYTPYFQDDQPPHEASSSVNTLKRPRGRPKGSKNKARGPSLHETALDQVQPPSSPAEEHLEKKRRGRPPKIRTPEDQAEYDRRKAEKEAGITKRRGRPRKNPDFLVRENRSKRLRALREQEAREKEERDMHNVFSLPEGGLDFGQH